MKKTVRIAAGLIAAIFCIVFLSGIAVAEEKVTFIGKVKSIDLKTNTVVVTEKKTEKDITVQIEDDTTLAKLKDGRINEGDEVKVKYIIKDGKNISTYFRKTAGC